MQGVPHVAQGQVNLPVTEQGPTPLVLGEVVRGEVITLLPDAVSMRIKKEILLAKTDVPLRKGEVYLLRVKSFDEGKVTLEVLKALAGETDAVRSTLSNALGQREGLTRDQMASLRTVLEGIPDSVREQLPEWNRLVKLFYDTASLTTEGFLKGAVYSSGIFFETKLREWVLKQIGKESPSDIVTGPDEEVARIIREDLKGNLLKLRQILHDPEKVGLFKEKTSVEAIEKALDKLFEHIERQQIESKLNGIVQMALPFAWKALQDGKMFFREAYHPQEAGTEYACVIQLDLEHAGKLAVGVRTFSDRLYLRFVTESVSFKNLIEANAPQLKKQLGDAGVVCDSIRIAQQEKIDFETLTWESELDIKI